MCAACGVGAAGVCVWAEEVNLWMGVPSMHAWPLSLGRNQGAPPPPRSRFLFLNGGRGGWGSSSTSSGVGSGGGSCGCGGGCGGGGGGGGDGSWAVVVVVAGMVVESGGCGGYCGTVCVRVCIGGTWLFICGITRSTPGSIDPSPMMFLAAADTCPSV